MISKRQHRKGVLQKVLQLPWVSPPLLTYTPSVSCDAPKPASDSMGRCGLLLPENASGDTLCDDTDRLVGTQETPPPELAHAKLSLQKTQAEVKRLENTVIDPKSVVGKAVSDFGLCAFFMPVLGSILILPRLGLPAGGGAALAGLVIGCVGLPALCIHLLKACRSRP